MNDAAISSLLLDALRRYDRPDLLLYKQGGSWRTLSSQLFLRRVAALAQALREWGLQKGDRVAIFSENRPEWHVADLATLGLGAINVPIYPAESLERLSYILAHSEARLCFVSGAEQLEKVKAVWKDLRGLETVIPFAAADEATGAGRRVQAWAQVVSDAASEEVVAAFERSADTQRPEDIATLIYTSGTTGTPKGALLTQNNFASNVTTVMTVLDYSPRDLAMSLLPLCHIFERTNAYCYLARGLSMAYAEGFDTIAENLREVRPTLMAVVPRFFEKLYARVTERVQGLPAFKQKLFGWGVEVGRQATPYRLARRPLPVWLRAQYAVADRVVYAPLKRELGGRFRVIISGGAPLSRDLNEFFHALGLTILEGYGLTETSPVISVNLPGATKLGTVGRAIPGVDVRIAEDGEVLTRGPHVMQGYYKLPQETTEVLTDGWFHTGDVGFLDADGFLTITDRKKDLIKTAGGKYVAPQLIENRLKASPYIQNAVVVGDRRRYAVALLVPNRANLERYAAARGIPIRTASELLAHPAVEKLLADEVESVNQSLAQFERLKRFAVLEEDFSLANAQLTYTQKVRRRKIEEHYRELIESLYREEAPAAR